MAEVQITDKYGKHLIDGHSYYTYEDSNFTSADSPKVCNVLTDLGRKARDGYIICDGDGDIIVEISHDGTNYGRQITLKKNDIFLIKPLSVAKIRITHSGTDSAYRILVN